MHTVFALLCFVVVIHWLISPYPSGLLHWHCGNLTIAPVPAKQPGWIWINTSSCEFIMNNCITTTKQSTTKPCAYFLGYTVPPLMMHRKVMGVDVICQDTDNRISSVKYDIQWAIWRNHGLSGAMILHFIYESSWSIRTRTVRVFSNVSVKSTVGLIGISRGNYTTDGIAVDAWRFSSHQQSL